MRVGFPTRTHKCRSSDKGHSLLGHRVCAYCEREITSTKL
jgi:ribosomal protein L32